MFKWHFLGLLALFGILTFSNPVLAGLDVSLGGALGMPTFPGEVVIEALGTIEPKGETHDYLLKTIHGEQFQFTWPRKLDVSLAEKAGNQIFFVRGKMPKGDPSRRWLMVKELRLATPEDKIPMKMVPSQKPAKLVRSNETLWTIENVRWGPEGKAGYEVSLDPYRFAETKIDVSKVKEVFIGVQSVPPVFRHAFVVFTFNPGGCTTKGKESPALVISIEPLRNPDKTKPLVEMLKGELPIIYSLCAWEDFTLYNCERWKQTLSLWEMAFPVGGLAKLKWLQALLQESVRPRLSERYDMNSNNCSSSIMAALHDQVDVKFAEKLRKQFHGPLVITNPPCLPSVLAALGIIREHEEIQITPANFFVPLIDLRKSRRVAPTGSHSVDGGVGSVSNAAAPTGTCLSRDTTAEWTFMVFMNADNNLEPYMLGDLTEMSQAGSTSAVNIIVLSDTRSAYGGVARKLKVTPTGVDVLETMGEIDMGDWHTLANFGSWAVTRYPARHYALIMSDHGTGWRSKPKSVLRGFSHDGTGSTHEEIFISKGEYAQAMKVITSSAGGKLDLVAFDACLMGMWELAAATAPFSRVLVASEESLTAGGFGYAAGLVPLTKTPTLTGRQLAELFVDAYHDNDTANSTMASVDLDSMTALNAAVSNFANSLMAHPDLVWHVDSVRQRSQSMSVPEHRDLWDFALGVKAIPSAPADLIAVVDALIAQLGKSILVSRQQTAYSRAHGLAIWIPPYQSHYDNDYDGAGALWSQQSTWDEFLKTFTIP